MEKCGHWGDVTTHGNLAAQQGQAESGGLGQATQELYWTAELSCCEE